MNTTLDLLRLPTMITAFSSESVLPLKQVNNQWSAGDVVVKTGLADRSLSIDVTAERSAIERLHLRWLMPLPNGLHFLGDHWERGYGDLEWRGLVPERILPWYFLTYDGRVTHGYGVKTQPAAFCFWMVDSQGVNLWCDVRNGGIGVELDGRVLNVAEVITRLGEEGETPYAAAHAFCKLMCKSPRLPESPVYGSNNWYYAYGDSNHQAILDDTRLLVSLAPPMENRPYMVIDGGWQPISGDTLTNGICGGPYSGNNIRFPNMPELAASIRAMGARPGIWIRPLAAHPADPESILLPVERAVDASAKVKVYDPSLPEVLERIRTNFRTLHDWGYDLIKHDWATCDIFGRWGFQMGAVLTNTGWHFADRTRTTAEITLDLYWAIRDGAGDSILIGCNTVGHLGAGLFELQRIGDDTSGREWERTRKMGVNSLAFRGFQHNAFFAADPDCVGHTLVMPWEKNRQFLELISRSGTVLFVSIDPKIIDSAKERELKAAFAAASQPQPLCEPIDWLENICPSHWILNGEETHFDWYGEEGIKPF